MKIESARLVVITGGGSGIGRATALRFAARGAQVVVGDIDLDAAHETVAAIRSNGGHGYAEYLDVTDTHEFEAFAARVAQSHGVPDVVVNNAGIGMLGEVTHTTEDDWERVVGINLLGVVHGARIFGKQMRDHRRAGHIVNIASAAAFVPLPSLASYSTTKYAVKIFSEGIRAELAPSGIGVSVICPGVIATQIFASAEHRAWSEAENEARRSVTGHAMDRIRRLHLIPGPDVVARAIESAVRRNRATVLIRPEAYLVYTLRRISPGAQRALLRLLLGERTIRLAFKFSRHPIVARILGASGDARRAR